MPSAKDIAKQALQEAERPEREHEAENARRLAALYKRQQAQRKRRDTLRLKRSPLSEWFPGVEWKVHAHHHHRDATVYESEDGLRLTVHKDGHVTYTPYTTRDYFDEHNQVVRDHAGAHSEDWWGPTVESVVDVGREMRKWQRRVSPPSGGRLDAEGYPLP